MKPTHRVKQDDLPATCWQFTPRAPIPIWVFQKFHDLDGSHEKLVSVASGTARPTDWICCFEIDDEERRARIMFVVTNELFTTEFEPVPAPATNTPPEDVALNPS